jgi:hypothetical protein
VKAVEPPVNDDVGQPDVAANQPAIEEDHPDRTPDQSPRAPVPERAPAP